MKNNWLWGAIVLLTVSFTTAPLPHTTCKRTYVKVGCFRDKMDARALTDELVNDRDTSSDKNDGHLLNWKEWPQSIHSLACRCAEATRKRGWKIFALQFYGECWSGANAEAQFNKHGGSSKCYQVLENPPPPCDKTKDLECVGGPDINYVYRLKDETPSDVNGGYSPWGPWTGCSKTCGGGTKSRERTCTNPPPTGGGRDCSHLGLSEGTTACNEQPCPDPPVDGGWTGWTSWTGCTVTCGGGKRVRERSCTSPAPQGKGKKCEGPPSQTEDCGESPCPVPCTKALDIGIILDGSGSVHRNNFEKAKSFLSALIAHFVITTNGTHFGIITYSTHARLQFNMADTRYHGFVTLKNRITGIPYPNGWTRTDRALQMAADQLFTPAGGDRRDKPNVLIVFTDGKTNRGSRPYSEVLRPLQKKGVRTLAVGIGRGIDNNELLQIAMGNPHYVVQVSNFDALKDKLSIILDESCQGNPPPTPDPDCSSAGIPLGMESGTITSAQLSATSIWDPNHGVDRARLHLRAGGGKTGAWSSRYNDVGQYYQVDFGKAVQLTKIAIQGRQDYSQWVTKYWVSYSQDGGFYVDYSPRGFVEIFPGNTDRNTVKTTVLVVPIYARFIRIHPREWSGHISMRLEFYGCRTGFSPPVIPVCLSAMGLQSGGIKDSQMTASSNWDGNHAARNARLHFHRTGRRTGAWSSRHNDVHEWLQVNFGKIVKLQRVATQGREDNNQWVKTYSLSFSRDAIFWEDYDQNGRTTVFAANIDRYTVVSSALKPPIIAQYVRFHPKTWHGHISMRAEFYGCTSGFPVPPIQCASKLGMESKRIPDNHITASSMWDANHSPSRARLGLSRQGHKTGAWSARHNDKGQWLQVDLGQVTKISRIVTQGRQDYNQWVKSYRLQFSQDGGHFEPYAHSKVLQGNRDRNTIVGHILQPAIIARYVRILPNTWFSHISLRMELYGCTSGFPLPPRPECLKAIGVQSGAIKDSQMSASSMWDNNHRAANGRLHFHAGGGRTGAWSSRRNNAYQWLQIDVGKVAKITRLSTQGRQDNDQWVTSYTLQYSLDGGIYRTYAPGGKVKVFSGNNDRYKVVNHVLSSPIVARYIRFHPRSWRGHISMRVELSGCTSGFTPPHIPECRAPLGLQSGLVKPNQMKASSEWNSRHRADNARLYFYAHSGRTGAWSSRRNDGNQWLQVDFGQMVKIQMVGIQGREDWNQWVTSYSLSYSRDEIFWNNYKHGRAVELFQANTDRYAVVQNILPSPIIARYVRILPRTWYHHISMRAEFYGCRSGFPIPPIQCASKLGMESKRIPDSHITASSMWDANHSPSRARLGLSRQGHKTGAWSARHNDKGQWLQVDLGQVTKISRIVTQGRQDNNQWVKSYRLQFSQDGGHFEPYAHSKVLQGNRDRNTIVGHILQPAIIAKYVRILPNTWFSHISLRMELYGCTSGFPIPSAPICAAALPLSDGQLSASSEWDRNHRAANAKLHHQAGGGRTGAWSSRHNNVKQWLQANFNKIVKITRVSTQGRQDNDQWVKSYTLEYSQDGARFTRYPKVFTGNSDRSTVVSHALSLPIIAQYVRILPKTWHSHISLRVGFYGCDSGITPPSPPPCLQAMDIGIIMDRSGSVGSGNFAKTRAFVLNLVSRLEVSSSKSRLGLIAYNSRPQRFLRFADVHQQTLTAINSIINGRILYTAGGTRTDRAFIMANNELFSSSGGDRADKPNVLIVMTDGKTNRGSIAYATVLRPLLAKGVKVIAVGVGRGIDDSELLEITSYHRDRVIHVNDFGDLLSHLNQVLRVSCPRG